MSYLHKYDGIGIGFDADALAIIATEWNNQTTHSIQSIPTLDTVQLHRPNTYGKIAFNFTKIS